MTDPKDPDRRCRLYHYTSTLGLQGILRTRSLWATDAAFLNDWQEIHYGAEPLMDRMKNYLTDYPPSPPIAVTNEQGVRSTIMKSALDALEKSVSADRGAHPAYVDSATYVACLSESHDDLGQWRGYGQHGYAIGFRKEDLRVAAPLLGQVAYGDSAVRDLCNDVMHYFETRRLGAHPGTYGYFDALNRIMPHLALVKHDAFKNELEWRLVLTPKPEFPPEVKTRVNSSRLVPYVEVPFGESCIAEIVIGPGGDFHSERAVRMLLRENGYNPNELEITQSRAPYRG
ncbi:DUF2971 domain-containing protein [Mycobacterium sp. SMC-14]|uniref:DUF2971 domain-containing protein n=1 Tax=Mycobacterium sp. SMC-14 TaxID=3385968 RepID=UPI00390C6E1F